MRYYSIRAPCEVIYATQKFKKGKKEHEKNEKT